MPFQQITIKSNVVTLFPQAEMVLTIPRVPKAVLRITLHPTSDQPLSIYLTGSDLLKLYSTLESILLETSYD